MFPVISSTPLAWAGELKFAIVNGPASCRPENDACPEMTPVPKRCDNQRRYAATCAVGVKWIDLLCLLLNTHSVGKKDLVVFF